MVWIDNAAYKIHLVLLLNTEVLVIQVEKKCNCILALQAQYNLKTTPAPITVIHINAGPKVLRFDRNRFQASSFYISPPRS